MVSRRYQSLKFKYRNDFNEITIKTQRAYYADNNVNFATPITNTFLTSVIFTNLKTSSTVNNKLRHTIAYYKNNDNTISELTCYLPFGYLNNPLLTIHIEEIKNSNNVICLEYYGNTTNT